MTVDNSRHPTQVPAGEVGTSKPKVPRDDKVEEVSTCVRCQAVGCYGRPVGGSHEVEGNDEEGGPGLWERIEGI